MTDGESEDAGSTDETGGQESTDETDGPESTDGVDGAGTTDGTGETDDAGSAVGSRDRSRGLVGRPQLLVAVVVGAALTVVGAASAALYGPDDPVFGVFGRNYLHDAVHLLTGGAGLAAGVYAGGQFSVEYNRWVGVVYGVAFVVGTAATLAGLDGVAGIVNLNAADNLLHLVLAVVLGGVGFGLAEAGDAGE